jgi:glycosyltransferase involved in cell wall biosynthesis
MGTLARVRNMFEFPFSLWRHWKEIADRAAPDVVTEATPHLLSFYVTRRIARLRDATLVLEVRDLWPQSLIELSGASRWNLLVMLIRRALKRAILDSDGVVSTLCRADQHYAEMGLKPQRFFHIQNGVEHSAFGSTDEINTNSTIAIDNFRRRFEAIIGYAGTMGRANSVDVLVGAAPALARLNVGVVLVGKGEKAEELRASAQGLDNVLILDAVPKTEARALIKRFDIGFVGGRMRKIHRFGVSPNKLFEYMACGVPVLFCIASPDQIVEKVACGYEVKNPTPSRIFDVMESFLKLPREQRKVLGQRGRDYACKHFSYKILAKQFVDAVEVLDEKG